MFSQGSFLYPLKERRQLIRKRPFIWEEDLVNQLLVLLQHVKLSVEDDLWWWNPNSV
jgi:hypothetical protein